MTYFCLFFVLHLVFGIACASIANETRHNISSWFVAGTVLGGLALIALMVVKFQKPVRTLRTS
jgi:hypothetical protein